MTQHDWKRYREIILVRHTEATKHGTRELTPHGKEQARMIAHRLVTDDRIPDDIVTADSKRSTQAGLIMGRKFCFAQHCVNLRRNPSFDGTQTKDSGILAEISALPDHKHRVALVGSQPDLGDALFLLSGIVQSSFEEYGKAIVLRSERPTWKDVAANDDAKVVDRFHPDMVDTPPMLAINFAKFAPKPSQANIR